MGLQRTTSAPGTWPTWPQSQEQMQEIHFLQEVQMVAFEGESEGEGELEAGRINFRETERDAGLRMLQMTRDFEARFQQMMVEAHKDMMVINTFHVVVEAVVEAVVG